MTMKYPWKQQNKQDLAHGNTLTMSIAEYINIFAIDQKVFLNKFSWYYGFPELHRSIHVFVIFFFQCIQFDLNGITIIVGIQIEKIQAK